MLPNEEIDIKLKAMELSENIMIQKFEIRIKNLQNQGIFSPFNIENWKI